MIPTPAPGEAGGGYAALARHYDGFTQNMDYKRRTEYLCALLCHAGAAPGALVLDLACGTGIYTYALLERGWDVIGVDASPDMLAVAHERNSHRAQQSDGAVPQVPLLLCQRLEELDLYGTAQAAACLTDSLNHLTEPREVRRFFRRLHLFLEPGAPFIFDVNTLYKHEHILSDSTFLYESDSAYCVWQNQWRSGDRTTDITLDIFAREEGGLYARSREQFAERAYTPEELTRWLQKAGFAVEHIYGELTQLPPEADAQRLFFICRRE